jgi:hypothetical protein
VIALRELERDREGEGMGRREGVIDIERDESKRKNKSTKKFCAAKFYKLKIRCINK